MILREHETNFIIDFDRITKHYILPYPEDVVKEAMRQMNYIKSKLVLLLNRDILPIHAIMDIVRRVIRSINLLENLILCNELEYLEDDIRSLLFEIIDEYEEKEEYEICSNIKKFLNNF